MIRLLGTITIAALAAQTLWEQAATSAANDDLAAAEADYRTLLSQTPEDPTLHYNLGTALARQGRFDDARPHLETAAEAGIPADDAPYNLGNTDLEPAFADSTLAERDERLLRSIESYKTALRADPADEDAKWNLELGRRLLARDDPPPSGGGGGGGGGGDGDGPQRQGERQPTPTAGGGSGPAPRMTEAEAEALLRSAQEREMEVQQERLMKPQPPGPIRP